jgi:hypothetical protein
MNPPQAFQRDATLGPLIASFVWRINRLPFPAGTRVTSWWRSVTANRSASGADLSQHLLGLAVDFVTPTPHRLVAAARAAGLVAIYHNVGSGWHVHVQAYPAGFATNLFRSRPWVAQALGFAPPRGIVASAPAIGAPRPAYVIPFDPRAVSI